MNNLTPGADPAGTLPPMTATYLSTYQASRSLSAEPAIEASLVGAAKRMRVRDSPFPHGVIDHFLPESIYEDAVRHWPSPAELSPVTLPGSGYIGSRAAKILDERHGAAVTPSVSCSIWASISSMLRQPEFVTEIFASFPIVIDESLVALNQPPGEPGFRLHLCRDEGPQDALGAHLDGVNKLLTIVIYISLDGAITAESPDLWGTTLYDIEPRAAGPIQFAANSSHTPHSRISFCPNRAFVMPNSRKALHGVAGGQAGVIRRSLMCGYWAFEEPR